MAFSGDYNRCVSFIVMRCYIRLWCIIITLRCLIFKHAQGDIHFSLNNYSNTVLHSWKGFYQVLQYFNLIFGRLIRNLVQYIFFGENARFYSIIQFITLVFPSPLTVQSWRWRFRARTMVTRALDRLTTLSRLRELLVVGSVAREGRTSWEWIIFLSVIAPPTQPTKFANILHVWPLCTSIEKIVLPIYYI